MPFETASCIIWEKPSPLARTDDTLNRSHRFESRAREVTTRILAEFVSLKDESLRILSDSVLCSTFRSVRSGCVSPVLNSPSRQERKLAHEYRCRPANVLRYPSRLVYDRPCPQPAEEKAQEGARGEGAKISGSFVRPCASGPLRGQATTVLLVTGEISVPALLSAKMSTV
jgi:hypothetical protein